MGEIVERNKAAQGVATRLRRELQELIEEAVKLGVLDGDDEEEDDGDEEKEEMVKKGEEYKRESMKAVGKIERQKEW